MKLIVWIISVYVSSSGEAFSYIGPGIGAGTFAVIVGIVGSIFLALFAVVFYPLRRMIRRKKTENNKAKNPPQSSK